MKATARLWKWFQKNARDLPWRAVRADGTRDPYHVWLAEIMLQQTQVKTVISYYEKFLRHYPNLKRLARAPAEKVLSDWAGLGYYSRARNLHACAKYVVDELHGEWPRMASELQKLPGLGPYTAAAMAALAFGEHVVALDGNVIRVLSRVGAIDKPATSARVELLAVGENLLYTPSRGGSAEALIELGALVCTPKNPACLICPLQTDCKAYQLGEVENYPVKTKAFAPKHRCASLLVLTDPNGKIFTITRGDNGLFAGMTALPGSAMQSNEEDHALFARYAARARAVGKVWHILTHIRFEISVLYLRLTARTAEKISTQGRWLDAQTARQQMPKLFSKVVAQTDAAVF